MPLTEGHSGYSSYSSIETLDRQYAQPIGKRVLLFIRTNPNIYLAGGVEAILKASHASPPMSTAAVVADEETTESSSTNNTTTKSSSSDPFAFLGSGDDDTKGEVAGEGQKKGPNIGRFLKKVTRSAETKIRQGMTHLAIRADGGKSPDWFVIGLYGSDGNVISMTDSIPMPLDETQQFNGLRFSVPLALPGRVDANEQITIKLWARSGAALLQSRHFLVGEVPLSVNQLRSAAMPNFMTLTLQSNQVADGKLFVCVTPDLKFPALCGPGWSLADPDVNVAYNGNLYHYPLDQSYGLTFPAAPTASWLIGTERTVESCVVLPISAAFAKLAAAAGRISMKHADALSLRVHAARHDSTIGDYVDCSFNVGHVQMSSPQAGATFCSASWQRPDAIFEVDLMEPTRVPTTPSTDVRSSLSCRFFPNPVKEGILPAILQAYGGNMPSSGFCLGNLRMQISVSKHPMIENQMGQEFETWIGLVSLDSLLAKQQTEPDTNTPISMEIPVYSSLTHQEMAKVFMSFTLKLKKGPAIPVVSSASGGLLSLMGLVPLCDWMQPALDVVHPNDNSDVLTRQQHQLATMGMFLTHGYIEQHCRNIRAVDVKALDDRASRYTLALTHDAEKIPSHEDRNPKPFRPSSSRKEVLLAGIPFNVHTASFSLQVHTQQTGAPQVTNHGVFSNVTCGAPSDHARDFGDIFPKPKDPGAQAIGLTCPIGSVSGGLRRLEAKRAELSKHVANLQVTLIMQVGNFFVAERQNKNTINHIPSRHNELQGLRWKVFEAVQSLHHVTWHCAIRRTSCFSQALGTAITSYLASLSDPLKFQSTWPELWAEHGYLLNFEGLLSAAGKELGMIEDASVGISMLRHVSVIIRSDDGQPDEEKIPVVTSPYLKWVRLNAEHSGLAGTTPEYTVEIGVTPGYYEQRIPKALQNGVAVRLYPLLFEVGVDIRQWGANTGEKVKNRLTKSDSGENMDNVEQPSVSVLDDEDKDDEGITDDDVLVEMNYEAYNLLNKFAHLISPANSVSAAQKIHPLLEKLHQHIVTSAGKMNHEILDEAATLSQQLGGGAVVFCKSGKDRTAMHVTYKQAQYVNKFRTSHPSQMSGDGNGSPFDDNTISDATVIREYGTRLPICEKNVGQAKYAFNRLQVEFMPDALRPPMSTLAGFLKGGKVFSGGGIES